MLEIWRIERCSNVRYWSSPCVPYFCEAEVWTLDGSVPTHFNGDISLFLLEPLISLHKYYTCQTNFKLFGNFENHDLLTDDKVHVQLKLMMNEYINIKLMVVITSVHIKIN
jgi:hypothetical protein